MHTTMLTTRALAYPCFVVCVVFTHRLHGCAAGEASTVCVCVCCVCVSEGLTWRLNWLATLSNLYVDLAEALFLSPAGGVPFALAAYTHISTCTYTHMDELPTRHPLLREPAQHKRHAT